MRHLRAWILAAAVAASPGLAAAQPIPTAHLLPEPIGAALLTLPGEGIGPVPLVILLPDALGEDGRAEPYALALAARGIAALVLGLDADPATTREPQDPAASPDAALVARGWAAAQGLFDPAQIGVLGFGLGGRAALAAAGDGPAAALYAGCAGLAWPGGRPSLLVQGDAAGDAALCEALLPPPGGTRITLPRVGHAWDAPHAELSDLLLPDPATGQRRRVRTDGWVTEQVAAGVAAWFAEAFMDRLDPDGGPCAP